MTAIRTSQQNAFEGTLTVQMDPNDLTVTVDGVGTLTSPCYLVIEMDDDAQREYIYFDGTFTGTTFVTTNIANRYLPGSGAGSNLTHPIGKKIRTYVGKQQHDDLHDRIDGLDHGNDLAGLGGDDHTIYSLADGTRDFTGEVVGVTPTVDASLATKSYVDTQTSSAVPTGSIFAWTVAAAPTGFLLANGAEVSRATYADLFGVIASIYGDGNGTTTFDLPDLRGRFPLGLATAGVGSVLGETGGSLTPTIDLAHSHTVNSHTHDIGHGHADNFTTASVGHTHTMGTHTHTTSIDHNHGAVTSGGGSTHKHTMGTHTHFVSDTTSGPTGLITVIDGVGVSVGNSNHTHGTSDTSSAVDPGDTNTEGSHTHTVDLPNYNVSNITSTAVDPGDTNSTSHSHTVNGTVTAFAGSSGGTSPGTNSQLSATEALPNPAYLALEFIIKT